MEFKAIPPLILSVELVLAFLLALYLLHRYANLRKQNPFATVSTLVVWFLSFAIIFLLPVDVSSAFYRSCLAVRQNEGVMDKNSTTNDNLCSRLYCQGVVPANYSKANFTSFCISLNCYQPYSFICVLPLEILWYILYWLFFVLSWLLLPLGQSYVLAGYFSVWKKLLRALVENAVFYVTLLVIVVILFVYLVILKKLFALEELPYIVATASNTWGLFILAFLLGYGLVEVPRSIFQSSLRTYTLNHCYFRAAKLYIDMAEANEELHDVIERVKKVAQVIHYNDPLRKYLDRIINKFPQDLRDQFSKGHDDFEDYTPSEDMLTKSSLESLYKKVTKTVRLANSIKIQWSMLTDQALDLEDIGTNSSSSSRRRFKSSVRKPPSENSPLPIIEWYWKVVFRPWVYRVVAVCLGFISVCIVWSEMFFGLISPKLSVFAYLVYIGHQLGSYVAIELLSIGVVAYLSICAYYTVFKIRVFNLYYLAPRHSTDEYSLLFSAVIMSRLALPICLNYLYMIQVVTLEYHDEDDTVPQTAFAYATGNTDLFPWLSSYFYYLYPVLILLICVATIFCLGSRLASLLGYQKFMGEDDFSADYIDEGKALIKRERRMREKSIRECGKVIAAQIHSERVNEILRDRENELRREKVRQTSTRLANNPPEEEGDLMNRIWSKAKGFAPKKSVKAQVRYTRGKDDDKIELLKENGRSVDSPRASSLASKYRTGSGQYNRPERPKKGIFDDI